jgi:translation initiation factor 2B subunit (eIF-2B alpha/beta/delta family)
MASLHLGHSMPEEMQDDLIVPTRVKSKKLAEAVFLAAASGSQHLVTIVADKKPNGTS